MNFGFNFGLLGHHAGRLRDNMCIISIKTVGDWTGHIAGSGSIITPNATLNGEDIYEYKWNNVTGEFVLAFGGSGDTRLDNTRGILVTHHAVPDSGVAMWDDTNKYYTYTDLDLATYLTANPDDTCFYVEFVPETLITYSFSEILTGEKV